MSETPVSVAAAESWADWGGRWREWVLRRLYRALLRPALGRVLKGGLDLEQLDVALEAGGLELRDLSLDEAYLSERLAGSGWEVARGSVSWVRVSVPLRALGSEACHISAGGLVLAVRPAGPATAKSAAAQSLAPSPGAGRGDGEATGEDPPPSAVLSSVDAIAQGLQHILERLQVDLEDVSVLVEGLGGECVSGAGAEDGGGYGGRDTGESQPRLRLRLERLQFRPAAEEHKGEDGGGEGGPGPRREDGQGGAAASEGEGVLRKLVLFEGLHADIEDATEPGGVEGLGWLPLICSEGESATVGVRGSVTAVLPAGHAGAPEAAVADSPAAVSPEVRVWARIEPLLVVLDGPRLEQLARLASSHSHEPASTTQKQPGCAAAEEPIVSAPAWGERSWGDWFTPAGPGPGSSPRAPALMGSFMSPDYRGLAAGLLPGFFTQEGPTVPTEAADLAESVEEFFDAAGPEALLSGSLLWQHGGSSALLPEHDAEELPPSVGDLSTAGAVAAAPRYLLALECPAVGVSAFHGPVNDDLADRQCFTLDLNDVSATLQPNGVCRCSAQRAELIELCLPTASRGGSGEALRSAVAKSLPPFSWAKGIAPAVGGDSGRGGLLRHVWVGCWGSSASGPGVQLSLQSSVEDPKALRIRADLASCAAWLECGRIPKLLDRLREIARPAARALQGLASAPDPSDVRWLCAMGLREARVVIVHDCQGSMASNKAPQSDFTPIALALDVEGPHAVCTSTNSVTLDPIFEWASPSELEAPQAGLKLSFGGAAGYLVGRDPEHGLPDLPAHCFLRSKPPAGRAEGLVIDVQPREGMGLPEFWPAAWDRILLLMSHTAPEDTPAFLEQKCVASAPFHASVTLGEAEINVGTMHTRCLQRFAAEAGGVLADPDSGVGLNRTADFPDGGAVAEGLQEPPAATVQIEGSCRVSLSENDLPWSTHNPPPDFCTYRLLADGMHACAAVGGGGRFFAQARLSKCGLYVASAAGERPQGMVCALACDAPRSAHGGLVLTAAAGPAGRGAMQALRFEEATVWATSGDPSFPWIGGLNRYANRASLGSEAEAGAKVVSEKEGGREPASQLSMAFKSSYFCYLPRADTGQPYNCILAVPHGRYRSQSTSGKPGWTFAAQRPVLHLGREPPRDGADWVSGDGGSGVRHRQWGGSGLVDPNVMQKDQYVALWRDEALNVEFIEGEGGGGTGAGETDTEGSGPESGCVVVLDSEHSEVILHSDAFRAAQGLAQQLGGPPATLWGELASEGTDDWEMVEAPTPGSEADLWAATLPGPLGVPHDHPLGSSGSPGAPSTTVLTRLKRATVTLVSGSSWADPASRILSTTGDGDFEDEEGAWDGARIFSDTHAEALVDLSLEGAALTLKQFGGQTDGRNTRGEGCCPQWQVEVSVRDCRVDQCDLRQVESWDSGRYTPDDFGALEEARRLEAAWRRAVWVWQTARKPRADGACFVEIFAEALPCPVARPGGPALETYVRVSVLPLRLYLTQRMAQFLTSFFAMPEGERRLGPVEEEVAPAHKGPPGRFTLLTEDVDLRLDYKPHQLELGRARQGGRHLWAELLNCVPLHGVELSLPAKRAICAEGASEALEQVAGAWLEHVAMHQAGQFVAGIRPLKSLSKVGAGASKLVTEPLEEYKKRHGNIARGVQRGMAAFAHALSLEVLQMGAHLASGAQEALRPAAGVADALPEVPDARAPADLQEGLAQALDQLAWGLDAASAVVSGQVGVLRQSEGGLGSTLMGALRAVPSAVAAPAGAAAGAMKVTLQGARNAMDQERYYDRLDDDP